MNRTVNPGYNNFDQTDNAFNIGLSKENHVRVLPGLGGTDVDEMSLDYIKGVTSYLSNFNFSTTNMDGDVLFQQDLGPASLNISTTSGLLGTPVWFLAMLFDYYRGGLIMKLKFAKTQFHSGRVAVVFSPGFQTRQGNNGATTYGASVV